MADSLISRRKSEHLRIVLEQDVVHHGTTLLEDVQLLHQALPELDLDRIETSTSFFGKPLRAPLMIASMTGGAAATREMNRDLARAAAACGIAFAVGSQRVMFRHPETVADFAVRDQIPDGVLLGNIGGVQLPQYSVDQVAELVERIEADGICVHLNAAQEQCQPEGDRDFRGVADGIARLVERLDGRVLVKETGAGMSPEALGLLRAAGVRHVDVSGSGGTSWTRVEMFRAAEGEPARHAGETFADWGIPTALSTIAARRVLRPGSTVVSSGGILTGMDCARAIAAGADIVAFARAALMAWDAGGAEGARAHIERLIHELRLAMLLTGSADVAALQRATRIYRGELRRWLQSMGWLE